MTQSATAEKTALTPLADQVEATRREITRILARDRRAELGQFLTPPGVARFMASLFAGFDRNVRVLEAGAGVGGLLAAFVAEACARPAPPRQIDAVAYEVDAVLAGSLRETADRCRALGEAHGCRFHAEIRERDFIAHAVDIVDGGQHAPFSHAILNPPYRKLGSRSAARRALERAGVEANNLYTAFVSLAILLLAPGGELCAITPRSFCNGPYFRPFRALLLDRMDLCRIHVFESRRAAFAGDDVIQENVIFHAVKRSAGARVTVSSSAGPEDRAIATRDVPRSEVVRPEDPERFIHIVPSARGQQQADLIGRLPARLSDLGLSVSTGRVVDFRVRPHLRADPGPGAHPLIYPAHFAGGAVRWPKAGKKPNALAIAEETRDLFLPSGVYVLIKRFSSKEERRRVVAAVFDPHLVPAPLVAFENHLNVIHRGGRGIDRDVARGIAAFFNTTIVDVHFRQWSGHTQVNAADLRHLRYPTLEALRAIGAIAIDAGAQEDLDRRVEAAIAGADQPAISAS